MKCTKILNIDVDHIDHEKIKEAADTILNYGTVVFPTETVYGIGANVFSKVAISKIYIAKGRPSDNPLIVHVSNLSMMDKLISEPLNKRALDLMSAFWPGPLTLIFMKSSLVPNLITAGLNTVAIRTPSHPIALSLISAAGVPIAAPSANLSGKSSPTESQHVIDDLDGRVDVIICSSKCDLGLESTVLDISQNEPIILRPGIITLEQIEAVIGPVKCNNFLSKSNEIPMAPGMKYKHYAPTAKMFLFIGELNDIVMRIKLEIARNQNNGLKIGVICCDETKEQYKSGCTVLLSLGSRENQLQLSSSLFSVFREFDRLKVDIILSESFEEKGIGIALMNRMKKASGDYTINV